MQTPSKSGLSRIMTEKRRRISSAHHNNKRIASRRQQVSSMAQSTTSVFMQNQKKMRVVSGSAMDTSLQHKTTDYSIDRNTFLMNAARSTHKMY